VYNFIVYTGYRILARRAASSGEAAYSTARPAPRNCCCHHPLSALPVQPRRACARQLTQRAFVAAFLGASGRGLGGHPRRGPPRGTRYLPGVYASLFREERLLSMLLSHERAWSSLTPCVFLVRVGDLLGKAARGGVVEQGDEPRPPSLAAAPRSPPSPLAAAPRCPPSPPPPPRALGWAAVTTSRDRCSRR
jgi:hypothetical protein